MRTLVEQGAWTDEAPCCRRSGSRNGRQPMAGPAWRRLLGDPRDCSKMRRPRPSFTQASKATMRPMFTTIVLLTISNVFMTFAWYAHKPWIVAALVSWGIALFEYLFQVPANRIGFSVMSVSQLKIMQEAITLTVFVPFAFFYLKEPVKLDYLWAALCIVGAVYFIFRGR
jgi:uncharacterized protein